MTTVRSVILNSELLDAYDKAKDEYQGLLDESKEVLNAVDDLIDSNRREHGGDNQHFREKLKVLRLKSSENCEKCLSARRAYEKAAEDLVETT